jgi:hypothetical protein
MDSRPTWKRCELCGEATCEPWRRCSDCISRKKSDPEAERKIAYETRVEGGRRPQTPSDWLATRAKQERGRKQRRAASQAMDEKPDDETPGTRYHGDNYEE